MKKEWNAKLTVDIELVFEYVTTRIEYESIYLANSQCENFLELMLELMADAKNGDEEWVPFLRGAIKGVNKVGLVGVEYVYEIDKELIKRGFLSA